MASYENNSLTLGSSATLSQNLVIKSNTDGTFTIERQSGDDLLTISANGGVAVKGTTTNDSAAAGYVGEYKETVLSSVAAPASNQFGDVASISLTAGDWDVSAMGEWLLNGATMTAQVYLGISTTSGNSGSGMLNGDTITSTQPPQSTYYMPQHIVPKRFSLAAPTTLYLKLYSTYSAGAPLFSGRISARRIR